MARWTPRRKIGMVILIGAALVTFVLLLLHVANMWLALVDAPMVIVMLWAVAGPQPSEKPPSK